MRFMGTKNTFAVDFLEEGLASNLLLSHIVFFKLPSDLKRELIHSAHSNYLSVNQILQNASAMKMLLIVRNAPKNPSSIKTNKRFDIPRYENKISPK